MDSIRWYKHIVPVAVYKDNQVLGYKNGWLCRMTAGGEISNICSLSNSFVDQVKESNRILARLFRTDIKTSCILESGEVYFFKGKTLYWFNHSTSELVKLHALQQGFSTPLNIVPALIGTECTVLWGDYFSNPDRKEVRIWGLKDDDKPAVIYQFPAGSIRHIHNIIPDIAGNGYYILTGDNDPQAGIYYADVCFNRVEPILIGSQQARAVQGFCTDNGIVYATDSVSEQNYIYKLEKKESWSQSIITPINGSCIYAACIDQVMYFSTTVESPETDSQNKIIAMLSTKRGSGILSDKVEVISVDEQLHTNKVVEFEKDSLPYKLFQYGVVTFPASLSRKLVIYPVGVKKYDGKLGVFSAQEE